MSSLAAPTLSEPNAAIQNEPNSRLILGAVLLFFAALFTIVLTGLPQFMDNEWRLSAYVLDMLQNGRWFCPTDANGDVISKPPMLAWLAAFGAALTGSVNAFAMYWPTAAATTATTALLFVYGRKYFGWRAGLFGAMAYAVSYVGLSQMSMPRYDGLLALPVTAAAFAAFSAWQTGRGWTWFWFFAAIGTLVKGPIAVLLPAFGLLAYFWERRSQPRQNGIAAGSQLPGILLFFVITGGWFALAYMEMGKPLIDKMLGRELVAHAVEGRGGPLSGFTEPTKAFLGIYAPWSVIALAGFFRIVRSPSSDAVQRRLERFLLLWFLLGLIMFSVAAHQRGRLIYPLIPAAALIAGLQLSRWTTRFQPRTLLAASGSLAVVFLVGSFLYAHVIVASNRRVQETLAMKALAEKLKRAGPEVPLTYVRSPISLQVWLNTRRPDSTLAQAGALLAGTNPAFVVTKDATAIRAAAPTNAAINEVFSWSTRGSSVQILSNRRSLEHRDSK